MFRPIKNAICRKNLRCTRVLFDNMQCDRAHPGQAVGPEAETEK